MPCIWTDRAGWGSSSVLLQTTDVVSGHWQCSVCQCGEGLLSTGGVWSGRQKQCNKVEILTLYVRIGDILSMDVHVLHVPVP